jgi:hypothetical protein
VCVCGGGGVACVLVLTSMYVVRGNVECYLVGGVQMSSGGEYRNVVVSRGGRNKLFSSKYIARIGLSCH